MNDNSPKSLGYRWPAEWEPQAATWISWPHNQHTWPGNFEPIPKVFVNFIRTIDQFQPVHILVRSEDMAQAEQALSTCTRLTMHQLSTNDCWIRDYGPWFLSHEHQPPAIVNWEYNAWGGKYPPFDDDQQVAGEIAKWLGYQTFHPGYVMEGGSVENNGAGVLMVTSQCLLNPNRNPGITKNHIEELLCSFTGAKEVLWLGEDVDGSIAGDDTDAHIDQIARFVNPTTILYANENRKGDINHPFLKQVEQQLIRINDSCERKFELIPLPMPTGVIYQGKYLPASYANFLIGNGFVIVPTFRCAEDQIAIYLLKEQFPRREVIGLDAVDLVWGLGTFHCASMQQVLHNQ